MFKGILSQSGADGRAARRLATVAASAKRSNQRHMRATARHSEKRLGYLRERQQRLAHRGRGSASAAMQASWTEAQATALAQEDATWAARDPLRDIRQAEMNTAAAAANVAGADAWSSSSASQLRYDTVDAETGSSVLQHAFDVLVHDALLRYGPPLPVEVVMQNHVVTAASLSPDQQQRVTLMTSSSSGGADDPNAVYMDEVGLKMHELMDILRKKKPNFSVRVDCDGVPLSLMVRNCSYLRAYGGNVNYMRFVRRLPRDGHRVDGGAHDIGGDERADAGNTMVLSLGRYKMREAPSQDGVRQGPQPWRYSYKTL